MSLLLPSGFGLGILASATVSAAIISVSVCLVIWVALRTEGFVQVVKSCNPSANVDRVGDSFKVGRSYARPVSAKVVEFKAFWDSPVFNFVCNPVGYTLLPFIGNNPVPTIVGCASPEPTAIAPFDTTKESFRSVFVVRFTKKRIAMPMPPMVMTPTPVTLFRRLFTRVNNTNIHATYGIKGIN